MRICPTWFKVQDPRSGRRPAPVFVRTRAGLGPDATLTSSKTAAAAVVATAAPATDPSRRLLLLLTPLVEESPMVPCPSMLVELLLPCRLPLLLPLLDLCFFRSQQARARFGRDRFRPIPASCPPLGPTPDRSKHAHDPCLAGRAAAVVDTRICCCRRAACWCRLGRGRPRIQACVRE